VVADGKICHTHCVKCMCCSQQYREGAPTAFFFGENGSVYCEEHYRDSLAKCPACQQVVMEQGLQTEAGLYHPACLTCHGCNGTLDGGAISKFNGARYHPTCLKCSLCLVPFTEDQQIFVHSEQLFCSVDYHTTHAADRCTVCAQPIAEGRVMTVRGLQYHGGCFHCAFCSLCLLDEPFFMRDERLACRPCAAAPASAPTPALLVRRRTSTGVYMIHACPRMCVHPETLRNNTHKHLHIRAHTYLYSLHPSLTLTPSHFSFPPTPSSIFNTYAHIQTPSSSGFRSPTSRLASSSRSQLSDV
jgi:hypothetical protein